MATHPVAQTSDRTTAFQASAPGRVNLLGEHVDYNQGVVLPAAVDRRVHLQARRLPEPVLRLHALDFQSSSELSLNNLHEKSNTAGKPLPSWALYPAGVAWSLQQRGLATPGVEVAYSSDIPIGAGLSSSAAIEVAFAALWQAAAGWQIDRLELALLCQRAEIEYVGVHCGAMDQIASACGVQDHALKIDVRSLQVEPVALPADAAIVIADSGVQRSLAGSAYNDRRAACEQAVKTLQQKMPAIQSLRDVSIEEFNRHASLLDERTRLFARHVVEEMARVEQGIGALHTSDVAAFGRLMLACHRSLRDFYRVSIPELDALVDIAARLPGCWGARLTGAGFGGCTVNLVEADRAEEFTRELSQRYTEVTGKQASIYACRASQGVTVEKIE